MASRSRLVAGSAAAGAAFCLLSGQKSGEAFAVGAPQAAQSQASAAAAVDVQRVSAAGASPVSATVLVAGAAAATACVGLSSKARSSTKPSRASVTAVQAFEGELGVQQPVGFWDPLGLSANGDVEQFKRRREVEIKHGRVAMLACMGYITPEYFKFPGYLSPKMGLKFEDIPNGLAALTKVPGVGWGQIAAMIGTYELIIYKNTTGEPGNYGAGNLGLGILGPVKDPAVRQRKLNAEIANGRLAMMAIMGMFFQNGLTGSAWGDWALYTDSPLR